MKNLHAQKVHAIAMCINEWMAHPTYYSEEKAFEKACSLSEGCDDYQLSEGRKLAKEIREY